MNYYISKLVIWFKNGTNRELSFLPNKVNVITGRSNTGKTAIIDIIDYCFFASKSKISESTINENVQWYSLVIKYDGELITFARKAPELSKVSDDYYFTNEVLEKSSCPYSNSNKKTVKAFFESIFGITSNVRVQYGGKYHSPNSKVSLRYFQMFNTISGNIIENDSGIFFDKQSEDRYREALPRVFDLAIGIETINNIIKKEQVEKLKLKLKKIERKNERLENYSDIFLEEKEELILQAKKYSLLPLGVTSDDAWNELSSLSIDSLADYNVNSMREELEEQYYSISNKIKKLKKFESQYDLYKKSLSSFENKIKPMEFLRDIDNELIKTTVFDDITSHLISQLLIIKNERKNKTPLSIQVSDKVDELENSLKDVSEKLKFYPNENIEFATSKDKYYFLGGISAKKEIFSKLNKNKEFESTRFIEEQISNIDIEDTSVKKELSCRAIEEFVINYMGVVSDSLENYKGYLPVFNYTNKSLGLRKPRTTYIENVGSSSNQMFLHLFFTLAMHDVIKENNSSFVAPYIIIDQPSRPYYGDESEEEKSLSSSDSSKIKSAFKLLNSFVNNRKSNNDNFQMIVLEHIPTELIEDMENINIVEIFRDGNALVKEENIKY